MPITSNAGQPFSAERFYQTRDDLVRRFGALTTSTSSVLGIWTNNGTRYDDLSQRIVIDVDDNEETRAYFAEFKIILQKRFEQIEIYMVSYLIERH